MWSTNLVSQASNMQSPSRSTWTSRRSNFGGYESDQSSDTAGDSSSESSLQNTLLWKRPDRSSSIGSTRMVEIPLPIQTFKMQQQLPYHYSPVEIIQPDHHEIHSQSSTLGGEDDFEIPEKTPTLHDRRFPIVMDAETVSSEQGEEEEEELPRMIGPLEQQLSSLMQKIIFMERENPTIAVAPEDYEELQEKVKTLEAEKATWARRHEALFSLRDEDVSNIINVRVLLAAERREHAAMRQLRDDDLANVIAIRNKLADATRRVEELEKAVNTNSGRTTPPRRPRSIIERRETEDLFQAAKNAALEQRALELEKANAELATQLAALKESQMLQQGGGAIPPPRTHPPPQQIRVDDSKRWEDAISALESRLRHKDEELAKARAKANNNTQAHAAPPHTEPHHQHPATAPSPTSSVNWNKLDTMLEGNAKYREKMATRTQQLRSELEMLQRRLHRKETECDELEVKVEKLQRVSNAGVLQTMLK
ncbi:hypothetical protein AJ80_00504 [Polytolypa hystricis UAMH7299]|uniref:Uncharacterized protein n=1 Tax=Polytolypa hystricis (strain UAMH7299) TaxID=1447883 RepID=A0A2B7Z4G5_POLH7|nr:hypothetical protein AJ80_00504 [Polytolypa hystricis UAMH7299]